jgi:hypothetical protein
LVVKRRASTASQRLADLPRVSPDDPRVGGELVGYGELAAERGQNYQAMAMLVRRRRIAPVAAVDDRGGRYLFARSDLIDAGMWPIGGPIDPARECWLSEYADDRGLPKPHLESMLRVRVAAKLGVASPVPPHMLAQEGVARQIGNRWAVNKAAADELLDALYDPSHEATGRELAAEVPGYLDGRNLTPVLKRAGVPHREIVSPGGRRTVLFDRAEAMRWIGGRNSGAGSGGAVRVLRTRVGQIMLAAPTARAAIPTADAAWLLGVPARDVLKAAADAEKGSLDGGDIPIAFVEERLVEAADTEGLLLLVRIVEGALSPRPDESREQAMLRLVEKAGRAV